MSSILIRAIPFLVSAVVAGLSIWALKNRKSESAPHKTVICEQPSKQNATDVCLICLKGELKGRKVTLPCGHVFCVDCLTQLVSKTQTTCSECRKPIPENIIFSLKQGSRLHSSSPT